MTEADKKRIEAIRAYFKNHEPDDEPSLFFLLAQLDDTSAELTRAQAKLAESKAETQKVAADYNRLYMEWLARGEALRFYGGTTDEGGLAFMPSHGGGFRATESKPGECARKALGLGEV